MNNSIIVAEQNNVLVVDSRIIAEQLGIQHKAFLKTIRKYQVKIEQSPLGKVSFENSPLKSGQAEVFAWLTEAQVAFLLSLSRSTELVIDLKIGLASAFQSAKASKQPIEPTTQPLLPVQVNQSKVFIVGDDNGVKALVPHDQIEKLLEIATLRKFKQPIDPAMFEGLDPACLALPLELIEALNEQLQIALKLSSKKSKPLGFGKSKK